MDTAVSQCREGAWVRARLSRLLGEGLQQQVITPYPSQHHLVTNNSSLAVPLISVLTHHVHLPRVLCNAPSAILCIKSEIICQLL